MMRRFRSIAATVAGVLMAGALLVPADARAEEDVLENSPVVRRQLQFRASRHEVQGLVGLSLAEPYIQNVLPGARYDYHWKDWLSFGGRLQVGIPVTTKTFEEIDIKVAKSNETFEMEATSIQLLLLGHASVSPVVGKMLAFDSLPINFDMHLDFSAGLVNVTSIGTEIAGVGFGFAGGFGGGVRIFVSQIIALTAEYQALVVNRAMSVNRDSKESGAKSRFNGIASFGLSFFMPPDLKRAD